MQNGTDLLRQYLLDCAMPCIIGGKRSRNIEPQVAAYSEIKQRLVLDLQEALNGLCRDKQIRYIRGLNEAMFSIPTDR